MTRRRARRMPPRAKPKPIPAPQGGTKLPSDPTPWRAPPELHALVHEHVDELVAIAARRMIAVVVFDSTLTPLALKRLGHWNGHGRTVFALSEEARTRIIEKSGRAGDLHASRWFAARSEPDKIRLLVLTDDYCTLEHIDVVTVPSSTSLTRH